jgi:hypothetical protein
MKKNVSVKHKQATTLRFRCIGIQTIQAVLIAAKLIQQVVKL